ncbi:MAG: TrkH family potassium uptake protein [Planctomycetes bacterium]|nr:TrkH family potassium uptake protein [Planctomycetota bacterium]
MNYGRVLHVVGLIVATISATMALPLAVAIGHGEGQAAFSFLVAIGSGILLGGGSAFLFKDASPSFYRREGLVVVGSAWIVSAAFGCLPYVLSGVIADPIGAYFETMSGFTTTGASVMSSIETDGAGLATPRSILFWRCMTNWLGGVGIVVLLVALLPALGGGSRLIFHFEVPGVGEKGFKPHIRETALTLWIIYTLLTAVEVLLLLFGGMDWFDAVCHSFASMATGGFSPRNGSVGDFHSSYLHVVVTLFMLLAGVNFTLYARLAEGKWREVLRDGELRFYLGVLLLATVLITIDLRGEGSYDSSLLAVRDSAFQVTSIATTTGFATADFDRWPGLSRALLVVLMFMGGSVGSTAGGMKLIRIMIMVKFMAMQATLHIRPRAVEQVRVGRSVVPAPLLRSVLGMCLIFLVSFGLGGIALALCGLHPQEAFTSSIATLGNIGPGLGDVGPAGNYSGLNAPAKVICTFLMLLGRLEIYTALALFHPRLWRD